MRRLADADADGGARRLQDAVDLYGNFRQLAYFYADVFIGTPPQRFSVITDTGSSLTAVPCDSCGGSCGTHMNPRFSPSKSGTCQAVPCTAAGCSCGEGQQCRYSQSYAEGSTIKGALYTDVAFLGDDERSSAALRSPWTVPSFSFGCQDYENNLFTTQLADGIMGIALGPRSFIRSLWAQGALPAFMFSMCMSLQGGAMTFGGVHAPLHAAPPQWAALSVGAFYVVRVDGLALTGSGDGASSALPTGGFNDNGHSILDTGTTFTYVPAETFAALTAAIRAFCDGGAASGKCRGSPMNVQRESLCYTLASPADIATFPSLTWTLKGAEGGPPVTVVTPPWHLFLDMNWDGGSHCLGIYAQSGAGAVLGANMLMGHDVIIDMGERQPQQPGQPAPPPAAVRVGFATSTCQLPPPGAAAPAGNASTGNASSGIPPPPPPSPLLDGADDGSVPVADAEAMALEASRRGGAITAATMAAVLAAALLLCCLYARCSRRGSCEVTVCCVRYSLVAREGAHLPVGAGAEEEEGDRAELTPGATAARGGRKGWNRSVQLTSAHLAASARKAAATAGRAVRAAGSGAARTIAAASSSAKAAAAAASVQRYRDSGAAAVPVHGGGNGGVLDDDEEEEEEEAPGYDDDEEQGWGEEGDGEGDDEWIEGGEEGEGEGAEEERDQWDEVDAPPQAAPKTASSAPAPGAAASNKPAASAAVALAASAASQAAAIRGASQRLVAAAAAVPTASIAAAKPVAAAKPAASVVPKPAAPEARTGQQYRATLSRALADLDEEDGDAASAAAASPGPGEAAAASKTPSALPSARPSVRPAPAPGPPVQRAGGRAPAATSTAAPDKAPV